MALIYKIVPRSLWRQAETQGRFDGAAIDLADGFIHFSTAGQLAETAAKHFAGQQDLLIVAIDEAQLGDRLVYEVSRGGALFPHLYGPLPTADAAFIRPLPTQADGAFDFSTIFPGIC